MATATISANGGARRFWTHATTGMRAVLCGNGAILVSRGRGSRWQASRILSVESITLDVAWQSDDSPAARGAVTRTMRAARRFAIAFCLLAGTAYAESPDGTEATPQVIWNKQGFFSFCWPSDANAQNWNICLNSSFAGGGIGSKLVYADGLVYTLGRDRNWWVWYNGWYRSDPPPPKPERTVLKVGPNEEYKTLAAAVVKANTETGSTETEIEVAAGTYTNNFMTVDKPVKIRAVNGPVILRAAVTPSNGKAIIVANANLEVDGLTFTGVHNNTGNGAGIRDHNITPNGRLTIRNSLFTLNDTGVLTDNRSHDMIMTVTDSKFINNGSPSIANPHALYVNSGKKLTINGSLFCGQLRGHNIKSRAADTDIIDNKLYDGAADPAVGCDRTGSTGRAIDIANGGVATITGNYILQGSGSPQFQIMAYGLEGLIYPTNTIVITNNTIASPGTPHSTMLFDPHCVRARPGSRIEDNKLDQIRTLFNPATC